VDGVTGKTELSSESKIAKKSKSHAVGAQFLCSKIKKIICPQDAKVFNGTGAKVDDNKEKTELSEGKIAQKSKTHAARAHNFSEKSK